MTEREERYFKELVKRRTTGADVLNESFLDGVWDGVVNKYSDQAHFIYELLQNADDVHAESCRFLLYRDRLLFAHDGKKHFTISDPKSEREDKRQGKLGNINAITSAAQSNKTNGSTIGKFGVGFKSVFQYTSTPSIYDPHVFFRIKRVIVPERIHKDHPERESQETLFVFPFDYKEADAERGICPKEAAFGDISQKLCNLSYPLLFLSHLRAISFQFEGTEGGYRKNREKTLSLDKGTTGELICLTHENGADSGTERLWLFTREYTDDNGNRHHYSAGFFLDDKGHLKPVSKPAFCFFPTKETTNLQFIFHAPFLLTDSREGIRAGVAHNKQMVQLLAELAADSLVYLRDIGASGSVRLIDDKILDIVPTDESVFPPLDSRDKISFLPFYSAIHDKFASEKLLPTIDGYTSKKNAYWAAVPRLAKLFSNAQLAQWIGEADAKWVFPSLGREEMRREKENGYIDSIIKTWIDEDAIFNGKSMSLKAFPYRSPLFEGIGATFIECQSVEWLHEFYQWLSESKSRTDRASTMQIFVNQDKKAVCAFDRRTKRPLLFLPQKDSSGYQTVYKELCDDKETVAFFKKVGIKKPSLKDEIENKILPKYKGGTPKDVDVDFRKFFRRYRECTNEEIDSFITQIKDLAFVAYRTTHMAGYGKASDLYYPSDELREYFAIKPSTLFLDIDRYTTMFKEEDQKLLQSFFSELGIRNEVAITTVSLSWEEFRERVETKYGFYYQRYPEAQLDNCTELIRYVQENRSETESVLLWDTLLRLINACPRGKTFSQILGGKYEYWPTGKGNHTHRKGTFDSSNTIALRKKPWLMDKSGNFLPPRQMLLENLSPIYGREDNCANELIDFLQIQRQPPVQNVAQNITQKPEFDFLSKEDQESLRIGKIAREFGLTEEELREYARRKAARQSANTQTGENRAEEGQRENKHENNLSPAERVSREISERIRKNPLVPSGTGARPSDPNFLDHSLDENASVEGTEETDADEYSPPPVDYGKRIEKAKENSQREIEQIAREEELQQQTDSAGKYTFAWFKALLELELLNSKENKRGSREISISFSKAEREPDTERTLILRYPNRYIPHYMEDLYDISLILDMESETRNAAIEAISVRSYTLRVKLKSGAEIDGLDLSKVREARITAKNPAFLLEALQEQFFCLPLDDGDNLQQKLCENIAFVFGPPGTGKTTYLAKEILIPKMRAPEDLKILVLTPTNKAADVLAAKIMDSMGNDTSYQNWLIRFGTTNDETIDRRGVYRDKTFDIRKFPRNITVTTIARFPYDHFIVKDYDSGGAKHLHLRELHWDYIVFDEASMIALADMVYPLYKKTPRQFIIAGDPFQIAPITSAAQWKDENIYTLTGLHSFQNPQTKPHEYPVTRLTTQYRSIPAIGEVFSQLTYGGILAHHRKPEKQRNLHLDGILEIGTLNLIKFPVKKYESIYRPKRIASSPYQLYSALFAFEFVRFLAEKIAENNAGERFSIGVITPYKAQGDLIDKLLASVTLPEQIEVSAGTIHGFQGDECDVILALFNPPPSIFSSGRTSDAGQIFLNRKNIINVSISRARDYLFVLMPDDSTENVDKLFLVRDVEKRMKDSGECREFMSPDLEEMIFGNSNYLEENSFSTSHQNVNVYSLPEKRYEIRSEDTALDVQIHKG